MSQLTQGILLLPENAPTHTSQVAMAAESDCDFEIFPVPNILRTWPPLTTTYFRIWKPSFEVAVL
jgi:hypothetical protein